MAREFLWLVKESAYGTKMASPVAGTDSIYVRLDEGNAFSMRPKPKMVGVKYGGGLDVEALRVSGETPVSGELKVKLTYSQALLLLGLCASRINTAQTAPWTTTELAGDLASVTIYHAIQRVDGTFKRKKYPGVKVAKWKIEGSREGVVVTLTIGLVAQKVTGNTYDSSSDPDATEFPAPAETDYPVDLVTFQHSSGGLKVANGGTARAAYESFSIDVDNTLAPFPGQDRWLIYLRFFGRKSKLMAKLVLKTSPDDRAAYEAITAQAVSLALTNGVNTITVDFKGSNYFDEVGDDLPIDKMYEQGLTLANLWNVSAAADLSVAVA